MKSVLHKILSLLAILVMLASLAPVSSIAASAKPQAAPIAETLETPDYAGSVLDEGYVNVRVLAAGDADLSKYGAFVKVRVPDRSGMTIYYGVIKADMLSTLQKSQLVNDVVVVTDETAPETRPDSELSRRELPTMEETRARLAALRDNPPEPTQRPQVTGWWDVQAGGHNAVEAWEAGYTGEGVKVAVNDSGVDMAHPDFWGTEARYENVSGEEYYDYFDGWPYTFSPNSNYLMAYDLEINAQLTPLNTFAYGASFFADTSTTGQGSAIVFGGDTYTTTGTASANNPVYHIGYHPDRTLQTLVWGERIAVLVVDEDGDGVYDTVYVDLNDNKDFRDDKPARKDTNLADNYVQGADELSWWDADNDGYPDVSGGMLYFISDGEHCLPFFDVYFGCSAAPGGGYYDPPTSGDLVAFMFVDAAYTDHGQLCATHVVAQGNTNGESGASQVYPDWKPADAGGMLQGLGRDAKLAPVGNIYRSFFQSTEQAWWFQALGFDGQIFQPDKPGQDDGLQASSNSFGPWSVYEDGWDEWSLVATYINLFVNPYTVFFESSGNTGPGYGTTGAPQPVTAIKLGSSAQFDSSGTFEPMASVDQMTAGDSSNYYSRGPSANNKLVPHLTANGGWGTGALALNEVGDGWTAWDLWGGTSRSAPLAMGAATLSMQAFSDANGSWPDWYQMRQIMMQGANQIGYDPLSGGTGYLNAARSAHIAAGDYGVLISPESWDVGDFEGVRYPGGFANIAEPGAVYTTSVSIDNASPDSGVTVTVSDYMLEAINVYTASLTTIDQSLEDGAFTKPDYLYDIEDLIGGALPSDTALVLVELLHTRESWAYTDPETLESSFQFMAYNWTDLDGDNLLWDDVDADGYVDTGEIDPQEYVRFEYDSHYAHHHQVTVGDPLNRVDDGLFFGIRHRTRSANVPTTDLSIRVTLYRKADWGALNSSAFSAPLALAGGETVTKTVSFTAPDGYGLYQGAIQVIVAPDGEETYTTIVPVLVNVAYSGDLISKPTAVIFGEANDPNMLYSNGYVAPIQDWSDGRGTAGEWRFFFLNQETDPNQAGRQTRLVARTWWQDTSPPADVDTYLLSPTYHFSSLNYEGYDPVFGSSYGVPGDVWGPYSLGIAGASESPQIDTGHWAFQTDTGSNVDYTIADLNQGLHSVQIHSHRYDGARFRMDYKVDVGYVDAPEYLEWDNYATERVTLTTNLQFTEDVTVTAYGLSPVSLVTQLDQFAPGPDSNAFNACVATYHYTFTASSLAELTVMIDNFQDGDDLDMFLLYDYDGDGSFNCSNEVIGQSGSGSPDPEVVTLENPPDGLYLVAVDPYDVGGDGDTFDLFIDGLAYGDTIQVNNLDAGSFGPGDPIAFDVSNKAGTCSDATRSCLGGFVQVWLDVAGGPVSLFNVPVNPRYDRVDLSQLSYKQVSDATALPGDVLTYTIHVVNTAGAAGVVLVTDTLPSGVQFASATPGYSYDAANNRISWSTSMPAGGGQVASADYDWVDISGQSPYQGKWRGYFPGLSSYDDDEGVFTVTLPFTYTFFGAEYTSAFVDANGQVQFGAPSNLSMIGDGDIPGPDAIARTSFGRRYDNRIAVLYGDQTGPNGTAYWSNLTNYGQIFTYHDDNGTSGNTADDRFIIQWDEWQLSYRPCYYSGIGCNVPYPDNTYQLILYPDGSAKAQYAEINQLPPSDYFGAFDTVGDAGVEGPLDAEGYKWRLQPASGLAWMYVPSVASEVVFTITGQVADPLDDSELCNVAYLDNGYGQTTMLEDCTQVTQAELTVSKTANASEALSGDVLTYTITINNDGPISTTVTLTDVLPASLTFGGFVEQPTGIAETTGAVGGSTFVTVSESVEVVFTVTVNPTTTLNLPILNEVTVDNGFGGVYDDSATVTINTTDLSASTKTVSDATAQPGDVITYTITIDNSGLYTATVSVEDTIPAELTFGGIVQPASGFSYDGDLLAGTVEVGPETSTTIVFTATVNDVPDGTDIENEADLDDGYNQETVGPATTTVSNLDLSGSAKQVSATAAEVGDALVYTITLDNAGSVNAAVTVTDVLPANLTFGAFTSQPAGITQSDDTVGGSTTVNAGESVNIVYTATVDLVRSGDWAINAAWIDDGLNDPFETNEVAVELTGVDLSKSYKMVSAQEVNVGDQFNYTIVLSNTGTAGTTVMITDTLPDSVSIVAPLPTGAIYDGNTHAVTWSGTVPAGSTVNVVLTVQAVTASSEGRLTFNKAWIDDGLGVGWWTNMVSTLISADEMFVTKLASDYTPQAGDVITYTIIVRNVGNKVGAINITDTLPSGLTYNAGTFKVIYGVGAVQDTTSGVLTGQATVQTTVGDNEVRFQYQVTVDLTAATETITNTVTFVDGAGVSGTAEAVILVNGTKLFMPRIFKTYTP